MLMSRDSQEGPSTSARDYNHSEAQVQEGWEPKVPSSFPFSLSIGSPVISHVTPGLGMNHETSKAGPSRNTNVWFGQLWLCP